MRVLYWLRNDRRPIGGVRKIYDDVDLLNELGFEAYVLYDSPFRASWFIHNVPTMSLKYLKVTNEDVIVIPEVIPGDVEHFKQCFCKVLYVQNWSLVTEIPDMFDFIITAGEYDSEWLEKSMNKKVDCIVHIGLDNNIFFPDENKRQLNTVLYLTRKNGEHGDFVKDKLKDKFDLRFVIINELQQEDLAERYREADIFLALGTNEGFQLPPLEAMACGCAVTGYSGKGAMQYMRHNHNCLVVEDLNRNHLVDAISKLVTNDGLKEKIRLNGMETAHGYSKDRQKADLKAFMKNVIKHYKNEFNKKFSGSEKSKRLSQKDIILNQAEIYSLQDGVIRKLERDLVIKRKQIDELNSRYLSYKNSMIGRLIIKYRHYNEIFFPSSSKRKALYIKLRKFIKRLIK